MPTSWARISSPGPWRRALRPPPSARRGSRTSAPARLPQADADQHLQGDPWCTARTQCRAHTNGEEGQMRVRKAVIPAAGLGTRFLPASKVVPKEMLPIVDRPVIQYVVEEAVAAGIEHIVIVTAQSKRAIEDHFDTHSELEARLDAAGKKAELEAVRRLSQLAEFVYVRQHAPLGNGHA